MNQPLALKYRSTAKLASVLGQPHVTNALRIFLRNPYSRAFTFAGGTGVGKTYTGYALANELGVDVTQPEIGGFYQVASGECTKDSVRHILNSCQMTPLFGSGWKLVLVNEVDKMSEGADTVWLDGLELDLPRTVICFSTNKPEKLDLRFKDRTEWYDFESANGKLKRHAQRLIDDLWKKELNRADAPTLQDIGCDYKYGSFSFRNMLQKLEPKLRECAIN